MYFFPTALHGRIVMNINAMDVRKLIDEPSSKVRSQLAAKIAMDYRSGNFSDSEADIADEIFRILSKDVEKRVRQSLAEQLAHCPAVPREVILRLANDDAEIAAPVLEYSIVLGEDDLAAIIHSTREVLKLCAIARRGNISENLCGSLMATHQQMVMADLFRNKTASISERQLLQNWDSFASNPSLLETLVHRGGLALTVAEKIFYVVSDELKKHLSKRYSIKPPVLQKAVADMREWEMLGIIPAHEVTDLSIDEQVEDLMDALHRDGRLTHSLLMRALCIGNLSVFEAGIAKLANVPRINARILLLDTGGLGLRAIYQAAGLPEGFYEAVSALLRLSLEETEYGRLRCADFRKRIIERIHIEKYNETIENMGYLLSIIGGRIVAAADVH